MIARRRQKLAAMLLACIWALSSGAFSGAPRDRKPAPNKPPPARLLAGGGSHTAQGTPTGGNKTNSKQLPP